MIEKVISGGQIGADIAGLRAAENSGLLTGGWLPKGCLTKMGPRPDLLKAFNMQECEESGYPIRTFLNVHDADGTIRFAYNFESPGERCTMRAIKTYMKPYLDIHLEKTRVGCYIPAANVKVYEVLLWVRDKRVEVLNVAGNADETIEEPVERFLKEVIQLDARSKPQTVR